jgi:hypothetical protein
MTTTHFRIHDLSKRDRNGNPKSYVAKSEADCKDSVDRSAYRSAVEHQDVITMGMVIVEPIT